MRENRANQNQKLTTNMTEVITVTHERKGSRIEEFYIILHKRQQIENKPADLIILKRKDLLQQKWKKE